MGWGGGKKCPKLRAVIYGRPLNEFEMLFFHVMIINTIQFNSERNLTSTDHQNMSFHFTQLSVHIQKLRNPEHQTLTFQFTSHVNSQRKISYQKLLMHKKTVYRHKFKTCWTSFCKADFPQQLRAHCECAFKACEGERRNTRSYLLHLDSPKLCHFIHDNYLLNISYVSEKF